MGRTLNKGHTGKARHVLTPAATGLSSGLPGSPSAVLGSQCFGLHCRLSQDHFEQTELAGNSIISYKSGCLVSS